MEIKISSEYNVGDHVDTSSGYVTIIQVKLITSFDRQYSFEYLVEHEDFSQEWIGEYLL